MIRQRLKALHKKPQKPLEADPDSATNAPQRHPFQQQPFNQRSGVLREEIWLTALYKLTATMVAVMIWLAVMDVPIALVPG